MLGLQFEGSETTANDILHPKGRYFERIITSELLENEGKGLIK
jgi:hypothetical protein